MPMRDEALRALREALQVSPENVPLRRHLATQLLEQGRAEEAEREFREALRLAPRDETLKLGLARAFRVLGKRSAALVLVEDLIRSAGDAADARRLHAELLLETGDVGEAAREYRRAVDEDPDVSDSGLEQKLGLSATPEDPWFGEDARVREPVDEAPRPGRLSLERSPITFADVGGMEELKEEIRLKIIHPLDHEEIYRAYGKPIGGGILMYGPPGCGKTHLARATAGEIRASFLAVGIHDVLDMWLGQSEANLHELFEQAREHAPCVLFFDEVDALGASRSDMRSSGGRHVINQFLSELDGIHSSNEGVLVLAATNAPWHLDSAFRRPGRFDRILFVPPPDEVARRSILDVLLRGKPMDAIDHDQIVKKTDGYSGADLKALVDQAVETKLRQALAEGKPQPLATRELVAALKSVRPSTKDWFRTARNYLLYANQSGLYDDVLPYLSS